MEKLGQELGYLIELSLDYYIKDWDTIQHKQKLHQIRRQYTPQQ